VHYSFLNYLGDLFWVIPSLILPIMVINRISAESNAYFYMAWTMSGVLTMIPLAITTSLLAEGALNEAKLNIHIRRSIKMMILLLVPAVVLVIILADKLLLFFGGLYAQNAATLLRWLAIASVPLSINMLYFNVKRVQRKMGSVIGLAAFMSVIVVVTSYFLLSLGVVGVGIAWMAGQSLTALTATVWVLKRHV